MNTLPSVRKPPHRKTVGIEIECFVEREKYYEIESRHHGFWYCGTDGSLSGFGIGHGVEFVSQPLSVPWAHRELTKLAKLCPTWQVNETCGIHVHVSKEWFTKQRAAAVWKWYKSLLESEIACLFGRYPNSYCKSRDSGYADRYHAINITNKHTIEVRSFRSGDVRWVKWCVDFTVYLVENARHLDLDACYAYKDMWEAANGGGFPSV